jgi:hypothetical protein
MFIGGICSIIFPFFRHMGINIAYSVIFSVFPGVIQIATPMLIVSILGFKALSTASMITVFAPCGIGAPVKILAAQPGASVLPVLPA